MKLEEALKEIESLRFALSQIKELLLKTGPGSATAKIIIATCNSALKE